MPGLARVHIKVYGIVQGVFFRSFTRKVAKELNVKGWVRNCIDGSVEIVAEGEEDALFKLINEVKKGPPAAVVENVDVSWEEYRGEFDDFVIIR
ncbi:acylphosphatase [Fervidicoccus fontis]|jgi:acylphosphatase|uniref:Acylphosphatase n=1 Tax=Fervidicoccus fontis TaxID=683846 RepID=A0A7C2VAR0_9CREN|nr:acylphosphatase [Fervidicoccus fontis]MBE9390540.1 acylphosphatase [Fervidicoccus fontis]PMB76938.1 MAG: acylphosphatase [Fervidicoccus fontis]HEW63946.1 acylphosphatase [Fervidicoccus fontis]